MTAPGGSALAMTYTGSNSIQRAAVGSTTLTNNAFGVASSTTGSATTYFTYNPTKEPNTLASIEISGSPYYYVYDALDNVVALIGDEGALRASYTYSPYGTTTASSGTEASANPFRFQGGYTDANGWVKFGDRYYNPTTMPWTQPDPKAPTLNNPTSYLLYSFDGNDPINSSDPGGLGCYVESPFGCVVPQFLPSFSFSGNSGETNAACGFIGGATLIPAFTAPLSLPPGACAIYGFYQALQYAF